MKPVRAVGQIRTEGQRQLLAVELSSTDVASRVGSSVKTVSSWRLGRKLPSADAQRRLQAAFGVPVESWARQPVRKPQRGASEPAVAPEHTPAATRPTPSPADTVCDLDAHTSLRDTERLLSAVREARAGQDLSAGERGALLREERNLIGLVSRLRRQAAIDVAQAKDGWVRSACYEHMKGLLVDALRPFPEACSAACAALQAAEQWGAQ